MINMTRKKASWEKRYTFRLTEEDQDIGVLLEQIPNNKRSEMIRKMLRYAYKSMLEEKEEKEYISLLMKEIEQIKMIQLENQKEQQEIKDMLLKGVSLGSGGLFNESNINDQDEQKNEVDEALRQSANAFLDTFGGF